MATVASSRAASTHPVYDPQTSRLGFEWGVYEIATALSKNDIVQFCRVPVCSVIDGFLRGDDIDTGTEALELDVGYAANGSDAADPDAFLNSGVITGDAVTGIKPETQIYYPFNGVLKDGPKALAAVTTIQAVATAAATAGATGTLYCGVYFVTGT